MSHASETRASRDEHLVEDAQDTQSIVVTCVELGMTLSQATSFAERSIESRRKLRL